MSLFSSLFGLFYLFLLTFCVYSYPFYLACSFGFVELKEAQVGFRRCLYEHQRYVLLTNVLITRHAAQADAFWSQQFRVFHLAGDGGARVAVQNVAQDLFPYDTAEDAGVVPVVL